VSLPDSSGLGVARLVLRPRFASAGRPFWFLAGSYLLMVAAVCGSLATWAVGWVVALVLFAVLAVVLIGVFAQVFRRTSISVNDETVTYHTASGSSVVLKRSDLVRMIAFDRLRGSFSGGVLLLLAVDGRRLGAAEWLWGRDGLDQVIAAVSADGRVALERRASGRAVELIREFGVDPAIKRRPVVYGAVLLASIATGILIGWPLMTTLLDL